MRGVGPVCAEPRRNPKRPGVIRVRVRLLSFFLFFGVLWRALVCSGHTCVLSLSLFR